MKPGPARRYRFEVEYDGAAFHGWQVQPGRRSVQGDLEQAFATLLREKTTVYGAGRTDSGVHAEGQVAHIQTARTFDLAVLQHKLNETGRRPSASLGLSRTDSSLA